MNLPLPPFDLPVTGDDRILASVLTGEHDDAKLLRSAQYIRQYLNAETAKLRKAGKDLLAACPHEAEGVQRATAALKMREALKL